MPQPSKGPRLGGGPAHERLLLANLAAALFTHKSIQTTEAKARRLRPLAERLITFAKRGDLHARRRVLTVIGDKGVVHELFTEIAPLVADRQGGYTRIVKTGYRKGDNAPMAVIELVLEPVTKKPASSTKSPARADVNVSKPAPVAEATPEETVTPAEAEETSSEETAAEETTAEEPSSEETPAEETGSEEPGSDGTAPAAEDAAPDKTK